MNRTEIGEIVSSILDMNSGELNEMVTAVKTRRDILARQGVMAFRPGDEVQFTATSGKVIECEVVRANRKTITCKRGYSEWRVPPSLLSHRGD